MEIKMNVSDREGQNHKIDYELTHEDIKAIFDELVPQETREAILFLDGEGYDVCDLKKETVEEQIELDYQAVVDVIYGLHYEEFQHLGDYYGKGDEI